MARTADRVLRLLLACALTVALAACGQSTAPEAAPVADAPAAAEALQTEVAVAAAPVVVTVREAAQAAADVVADVLPLPSTPPVQAVAPSVSPAGVDLIVRWEVTSPAYYARRLEWPIWPGGASGVTWGIGYDGGHQTTRTIEQDWSAHAHLPRLAATSGIAGERARHVAAGMRDVRTPYAYAHRVFADASLPAYHAGARRAYGTALDAAPQGVIDALVSVQYNRGGAMTGDRNREKRVIRDECLPRGDAACVATQIRSMCRLWRGTPNGNGLCGRRDDEARHAETFA